MTRVLFEEVIQNASRKLVLARRMLGPQRSEFPVTGASVLQCAIGNRATKRLLQAKLRISQPEDAQEQEAERISQVVLRTGQPQSVPEVVRRLATCARSGQPGAVECGPEMEREIRRGECRGHELPQPVRRYFEPRLGADLGQVRVVDDRDADRLARALTARAFTTGRKIFFASGEYRPETNDGRKLLAHELVHVVQQQSGSPVVRRWKGPLHRELTREGVEAVFGADEVDTSVVERLAWDSIRMDWRILEIVFNVGGWRIGKRKLPAPEKEAKLIKHYQENADRAAHHGEAGCYDMDPSAAATTNEKTQDSYVQRGMSGLRYLRDDRETDPEVKLVAATEVLKAIGDALHVAQDRGAHEEGARGCGHARTIFEPDFDPDDPNCDSVRDPESTGSARRIAALENTKRVLAAAREVLSIIMEPGYLRRLRSEIRRQHRHSIIRRTF